VGPGTTQNGEKAKYCPCDAGYIDIQNRRVMVSLRPPSRFQRKVWEIRYHTMGLESLKVAPDIYVWEFMYETETAWEFPERQKYQEPRMPVDR
jgi:hypothetical protein